MRCGLLGNHLSHSYSPLIHSYLGDYSYTLFDKDPNALAEFLQHGDFTGINVTAPYKKAVIPYCSSLSIAAEKLGAVNTIIRNADGTLTGHNTDYFGFSYLLQRSGIKVCDKKVLVLGSGGAAAAVFGVLTDEGAQSVIISRNGENNFKNLHLHADASLIVNATPVGMYPNTGTSPIDLTQFPQLEGVLDIIYNPARTQLLMDAERLGIQTLNGLWMLVAQAKEASEWFTSRKLSNDSIADVYAKLTSQLENIVLIGMPGCGKSTVGKILAQMTGKNFIDTDEEVIRLAGKSIEQIFSEDGEEHFRQLETETLRKCGKESGLVIATGGGCVTQKENYPLLHQNSKIIWLQRDILKLPTIGRPLSVQYSLQEMYAERKGLYQAFADQVISNDSTPEQAAAAIASMETYV